MSSSEGTTAAAGPGIVAGGGEMGALARALDWSHTPVGPMASWPQSLRTAVSILLESRFAMMIAWGRELTQFYNDPFRPILGATKHPALGKSTRDTFAEAWHLVGPLFEQVMQGQAVAFEDMLVPLDRYGYLEECFFHYSYSPIRDESGGVGGLLCTVTETTARVLAERRLRTLRDLALRAGRGKDEADAWRGTAEVLGGNAADLPFALLYVVEGDGRTARLIAPVSSPLGPSQVALAELASAGRQAGDGAWPLGRAVVSGPVLVEDVRARFGDHPGAAWPEPVQAALVLPIARPGLERPYGFLVAGLSPRRALDDHYRDFLGLVSDQIATSVGNVRALEDERRRGEALRDLDRQKTAFFSNVSHEFRTPLTLMLGPTEDALASPERALRGADLDTVHRNELRLLKLVNRLLDFSRVEAGRLQATFEPIDLASVTRQIASAFDSAIARGTLHYRVDCPPLAEPVYVDRELWEKIVLNLLSNALKFTFDGEIAVTLRPVAAGVELAVSDTGVGIPAGELPRLFERFHRVEGTRARTHEGSGIGLALCHELARLHGGTITVESEVGKGSSFRVWVPFGSAHLPPDRLRGERPAPPPSASREVEAFVEEAAHWLRRSPPPGVASSGIESAPPPPPSPSAAFEDAAAARILLADDNADMRDYLSRLISLHWSVVSVADGQEALELAQREHFDLVLTDVMMPRLDGIALLRALRAHPATATLPVIMLSARAGDESKVEGLEAGADDYLVKPFSTKEVLARVATQLNVARLRRHAEVERERAESADRAKDAFLAMLGHELRNPLAPISTSLHLLRMKGNDSREVQIIERQVGHLKRLVDDLLDVSRITKGKVELRRQPLEISTVIQRGVEIASPLLEQRRQKLDLRVPAQVLIVDGDSARLAQVVANLLTNAAKYSDHDRQVTVVAAREGDNATISVRDQGIGIAASLLDRVFDLFFQPDQALDRAAGGLGLGLAIVRSLVSLHGGSVVARSDGPGKGSEFIVTLPLWKEEEAALSERPAAPGTSPPARAHAVLAPERRRVLVVDDNRDAAATLAETLRHLGHDTRTAADGPSALDVAASFRPHVALLDIGLPVMDGYELARLLRSSPHLPRDAKLIALTGYGQEGDKTRSRAAGFSDHLVKPVSVELLARAVNESPPPGTSG